MSRRKRSAVDQTSSRKSSASPNARTNRRTFLRRGTAVAATPLLTPLAVHTAIAAEPAKEVVNVAIAGLNGRGGEHVRGFLKDPRSRITAVIDVDPSAAKQRLDGIEEKQGSRPVVFDDIRKTLDDPNIDVIACATPNHWHALMGVWAMQAGKDVYIEKPISHNIHEGRALVAASEKYDRVFQTGTQCRSSEAIRDAMQFIADGNIGTCNFARGLCYKRRKSIGPLGDYAIPEGIDFDLWSGPATLTDPRVTRSKFHYDWHWQRHYGNGDLGNQGPHQTDIARWGLGLDRHPQAILTYGGRLGYQAERNDPTYVDAGDTANTEVSIYDYGDKTIVFETRGLDVTESAGPEVDAMFGKGGGNKIGVIFYGEDGYVAQTSYHRAAVFDRDLQLVKEFTTTGVGDAHFANFLDAVMSRDRSATHADAMTGHLSAAVSHLGNISYYLGERNRVGVEAIAEALQSIDSRDDDEQTLRNTVAHLKANGVDLAQTPLSLGPKLTFDPESETFVDSDDANEMLTRAYREGFEVPAAANI